jgi:hypothetical protein
MNINWSKPIIVGGVPVTCRLLGSLNGNQLVVVTDGPQAVDTLFVVYSDGSSRRIETQSETYLMGPEFSNGPEEKHIGQFVNVYAEDDYRLLGHTTLREAASSRGKAAVGCVRLDLVFDDKGNLLRSAVTPVSLDDRG